MEKLIVQTGVKHGQIAEIARSQNGTLTIGRSYTNDIVLTDPYIAAKQLFFSRSNEAWTVDILDQTNPVLLNGKSVTGTNINISSGDQIIIGRTKLGLFADDHVVEKTHKLFWLSKLHAGKVGITTALIALVTICLLDGLISYLLTSISSETKEFGLSALILGATILFWAGAWSLIGRLLRHQHHFSVQVFITSLIIGLLIFIAPLIDYIEYISSSHTAGELATYAVAFITLAVMLKFNLFYATNIRRNTLSAIVVSALLVVFTYTTTVITKEDFSSDPAYSSVLKPPFAKISTDQTIDSYLNAVESSF